MFYVCLIFIVICSYSLIWESAIKVVRIDEPIHKTVIWSVRPVRTLVNQIVVSDCELMHYHKDKEFERHIERNLVMGLAEHLIEFCKITKDESMSMPFSKTFRAEVDVVERKEY